MLVDSAVIEVLNDIAIDEPASETQGLRVETGEEVTVWSRAGARISGNGHYLIMMVTGRWCVANARTTAMLRSMRIVRVGCTALCRVA